jgi:hypothetical protein
MTTSVRPRRRHRLIGAPRANMCVIAVAYAIFALSLLLQPSRWAATPAYRNLLAIMPQYGWGAVFAALAVLLAAAVWWFGRQWLSVLALTAAFMVTTAWGGAFIVRWLTSANTTPETWVSWLVFDFLLLRAAALLDYEEVKIPRNGRPHA